MFQEDAYDFEMVGIRVARRQRLTQGAVKAAGELATQQEVQKMTPHNLSVVVFPRIRVRALTEHGLHSLRIAGCRGQYQVVVERGLALRPIADPAQAAPADEQYQYEQSSTQHL